MLLHQQQAPGAKSRPHGRLSVLVVDDEKNIRPTLRVCLEAAERGDRGGVGAGRVAARPNA